jgi:hypothetical protein
MCGSRARHATMLENSVRTARYDVRERHTDRHVTTCKTARAIHDIKQINIAFILNEH